MSSYTITVVPNDDSGAQTTLVVDTAGGHVRVTDVHLRAPAGLSEGRMPAIDVSLLLRAVAAGGPTGPESAVESLPAAPAERLPEAASTAGDDTSASSAGDDMSAAPTTGDTSAAPTTFTAAAETPAPATASTGRASTGRASAASKGRASTGRAKAPRARRAAAVTAEEVGAAEETAASTTGGRRRAAKTAASTDGGRRVATKAAKRTAATPATPATATKRAPAATARKKAATKATTAPAGRIYRRMPEDLAAVYQRSSSPAAIAAHYKVPRYTAQGWVRRLKVADSEINGTQPARRRRA
jgi:hypothetical protein